jgi:superfamily II DNA/RNA helicase
VDRFRHEAQISLQGRNIPNPIITFEEANLPSYVRDVFDKLKYEKPTPIQAQVGSFSHCQLFLLSNHL